jgi:hypothetical protein
VDELLAPAEALLPEAQIPAKRIVGKA